MKKRTNRETYCYMNRHTNIVLIVLRNRIQTRTSIFKSTVFIFVWLRNDSSSGRVLNLFVCLVNVFDWMSKARKHMLSDSWLFIMMIIWCWLARRSSVDCEIISRCQLVSVSDRFLQVCYGVVLYIHTVVWIGHSAMPHREEGGSLQDRLIGAPPYQVVSACQHYMFLLI